MAAIDILEWKEKEFNFGIDVVDRVETKKGVGSRGVREGSGTWSRSRERNVKRRKGGATLD